jgi:hypothetical protein
MHPHAFLWDSVLLVLRVLLVLLRVLLVLILVLPLHISHSNDWVGCLQRSLHVLALHLQQPPLLLQLLVSQQPVQVVVTLLLLMVQQQQQVVQERGATVIPLLSPGATALVPQMEGGCHRVGVVQVAPSERGHWVRVLRSCSLLT